MGFAPKGVTKISQLEIDADKDWALKAITRLTGLDASQVRGDIWSYDFEDHANLIVKRLLAAEAGKILCSRGPGKPPFWAWLWEEPGGTGTLDTFYAALIDLTHDEAIEAVDQAQNEAGPITSEHKQNYADDPDNYIKRKDVTIALVDAEVAGITPDQTQNENAPITSTYATAVA